MNERWCHNYHVSIWQWSYEIKTGKKIKQLFDHGLF